MNHKPPQGGTFASGFGPRLIILLASFALPALLWFWFMGVGIPEVTKRVMLLDTPALMAVGIWTDSARAIEDTKRHDGRALSGPFIQNGSMFYVVTDRRCRNAAEEKDLSDFISHQLLGLQTAPPRLVIENSQALKWLPTAGKSVAVNWEVIPRSVTTLRPFWINLLSVLTTLLCTALYVLLVKALLKLFRERKQSPND